MNTSSQVQLVEAENISHNWKRFHVAGLVAAALFGIISGICLSTLYDDSEPLCGSASFSGSQEPRLNGRFAFINASYIYLIVTPSEGSEGACSFSEYTFISSFIFACTWMVFFLMCGAGGKSHNGLPQPWRIVPPAAIFSSMFLLISIGAGTQTSLALTRFCTTFDKGMTSLFNNSRYKCQDLNLFRSPTGDGFLYIETAMELAEITGWLCVTSWAFTAGLCLARLFIGPDFRPILKTSDIEVSSGRGYKVLQSSGSSTTRSSSSFTKNSFIVTGTSQVEIHATPMAKDDIINKDVNTDDVPPDNHSTLTMSDRDIAKKHVRLDLDAHVIRE